MQFDAAASTDGRDALRAHVRRGASRAAVSGAWLVVVMLLPELAEAAVSRAAGPEPTLAYLDPGTGSFVIQAVVAGLAGAAVTIRLYWGKIKGFFGGTDPDAESTADDE